MVDFQTKNYNLGKCNGRYFVSILNIHIIYGYLVYIFYDHLVI
jgi:hypothetical protein